MRQFIKACSLAGVAASALTVPLARAQDSVPQGTTSFGDIVVTAQRRSEALNNVGMSISAVAGSDLADKGVTSTADLSKVVAGLSVSPPNAGVTGAPIYTMRGVGFNEKSLSALSAVSFYNDEAPLNYPWMTAGPTLDLQRVEVLKGPQGTLYGQNSTGGAINFIANKPTDEFAAGGQASYSRFNNVDLEGFVSGPISSTLGARVAVRYINADGWQKSISRPGDRLGAVDQLAGRAILKWEPGNAVRVSLIGNGWRDKSDTLAAQLIGYNPYIGFDNPPYVNAPNLLAIPLSPKNPRLADWTPRKDLGNDNWFAQGALRAEFDISDDITLTSITSYAYLRTDVGHDADGSGINFQVYDTSGSVKSFNQELRIGGKLGALNWLTGVNYSRDIIKGSDIVGSELSGPGAYLGLSATNPIARTKRKNRAIFANADYAVTDTLSLLAGIRYTKVSLDFDGCARDNGDGSFAALVNFLGGGTAGPGECVTYVDPAGSPGLQGMVSRSSPEDNVSWRVGANWKVQPGVLIYGNVSRGYKSGDFPTLTGLSAEQYNPVKQEQVTAYEAGIKATVFNGNVQLNAAAFHYDYKDKQLYAYLTTFVGLGEGTVNIPKSTVDGFELSLGARPITGLSLNGAVGYTKTKIGKNSPPQVAGFTTDHWPPDPGFVSVGIVDVSGDPFNLSPKWQANFDAEYEFPVSESMKAFVGGSGTYSSSTLPLIGASELSKIPSYTLLNLRLGVASSDDKWRVTLWGRNITNELYTVAIARTFDATGRFTGMPVTYGVTVSYRP